MDPGLKWGHSQAKEYNSAWTVGVAQALGNGIWVKSTTWVSPLIEASPSHTWGRSRNREYPNNPNFRFQVKKKSMTTDDKRDLSRYCCLIRNLAFLFQKKMTEKMSHHSNIIRLEFCRLEECLSSQRSLDASSSVFHKYDAREMRNDNSPVSEIPIVDSFDTTFLLGLER
jgi:hypothetical protein